MTCKFSVNLCALGKRQQLKRASIRRAAVEFRENGVEHGIVRHLRKQRHARSELEIVRVAHDGSCVGAVEGEERLRYLDQARAEHGVGDVLPCFLDVLYRVKLSRVAHAEAGDLRKDVPHPVAALAPRAYLAQRGVVRMLLSYKKTVK